MMKGEADEGPEQKRRLIMTPERLALLENIIQGDISLHPMVGTFDENLEMVKAFREKEGHCDHPDPKLRKWIVERRNDYRIMRGESNGRRRTCRINLNEEKLEKLKGIGLCMTPPCKCPRREDQTFEGQLRKKMNWSFQLQIRRYEERLEELQAYKARHGHCRPSRMNEKLAKFMGDVVKDGLQRRAEGKKADPRAMEEFLTPERVLLFQEIFCDKRTDTEKAADETVEAKKTKPAPTRTEAEKEAGVEAETGKEDSPGKPSKDETEVAEAVDGSDRASDNDINEPSGSQGDGELSAPSSGKDAAKENGDGFIGSVEENGDAFEKARRLVRERKEALERAVARQRRPSLRGEGPDSGGVPAEDGEDDGVGSETETESEAGGVDDEDGLDGGASEKAKVNEDALDEAHDVRMEGTPMEEIEGSDSDEEIADATSIWKRPRANDGAGSSERNEAPKLPDSLLGKARRRKSKRPRMDGTES
uniref:Helicase-associated domain-containing protein n=2 Tax=Odontella aurita TaxID=265563 RepID=A0A7S4J786_9STRA|mmetsp:Transcript_40480/g.121974  ORF Transcript_40480/g.121974 Transcript_40480/m.121974 type:complete len:478 (+) Transcript_40480:1194-2627(+)